MIFMSNFDGAQGLLCENVVESSLTYMRPAGRNWFNDHRFSSVVSILYLRSVVLLR